MDNILSDKARILLVDDTPTNIDILNTALEEYHRLVALNGEKALKLAGGPNKPDLILLDIMMPEMDGFEVCRRLKADPATQHIPIIFITSITDTESIIKGFELGAADYVTKPFNISELKARVSTQISLKRSQDEISKHLEVIEERNKLITDSIFYAKKLQNAILPDNEYLDKILPSHFILYKPKDIVCGDFYWIKKVKDEVIVIAADCTGHGVPGALMSMLGSAFLNEIIISDQITRPSKILDSLREKVINSLKQGRSSQIQDGMDISIVSINPKEKKLEFSGAKNPLCIIRKNEMIKVKADSMPVSIYPKLTPYENHTIELEKNDMIYLFSDGFADQFGGDKDQKLKGKPFHELLVECSNESISKQKKMFEEFFEKWKGDMDQTDDVLLIGINV